MGDHNGVALLLDVLPPARELIADRGYDSGRFRDVLGSRHPTSPRRTRKHPRFYDARSTDIATGSTTCLRV